jgi:hypothetical protein
MSDPQSLQRFLASLGGRPMSSKVPWRKEMPPLLQFLEQKLNNRVRGHDQVLGYDLYFVDLSAWKLRFSNATPILWLKESDLLGFDNARQVAESLIEALRMRGLIERQSIVVVEGAGWDLRAAFQLSFLPILVLDSDDARAVMESRRPTGELLDRLCTQLSPALLSPYEISKPVYGSRFFGRESDLRRILYGSDSNYAVMGIRRIGKSSLLREVERRLQEQVQDTIHEGSSSEDVARRIYYKDCSSITSSGALMQAVVGHFHPQELTRLNNRQFPLFFPDFTRRMARRYGGQLVFLLDEFDALLRAEFANEELLDQLRAASNEGHCRFIFAGFRDLLNETSSLRSPFFNFAKPLRLKEFSREDAASLILVPLDSLRIRLERREEIVDLIYGETAGQPNLIQYYCTYLVDKLDRNGTRTIAPEDLAGVPEDENFRAFLVNTFMDNTDHLEKALVFSLILFDPVGEKRYDLEMIEQALRKERIDTRFLQLERACRNLELTGILDKSGRHYYFAIPIFPRVLRANYNVKYLLGKIRDEGI